MNHAGGHHRKRAGGNRFCRELAESWQQLAHESSYSASALAKACGVSAPGLERLFQRVAGQPAERWLKSVRMRRALELLRDGSTVEEAAASLAYGDAGCFIQDFREHYGFCPGPVDAGPLAKSGAKSGRRFAAPAEHALELAIEEPEGLGG